MTRTQLFSLANSFTVGYSQKGDIRLPVFVHKGKFRRNIEDQERVDGWYIEHAGYLITRDGQERIHAYRFGGSDPMIASMYHHYQPSLELAIASWQKYAKADTKFQFEDLTTTKTPPAQANAERLVAFQFDDLEHSEFFLDWLFNFGEDAYWEWESECDEKTSDFNYSRAFPEHGYTPALHGRVRQVRVTRQYHHQEEDYHV